MPYGGRCFSSPLSLGTDSPLVGTSSHRWRTARLETARFVTSSPSRDARSANEPSGGQGAVSPVFYGFCSAADELQQAVSSASAALPDPWSRKGVITCPVCGNHLFVRERRVSLPVSGDGQMVSQGFVRRPAAFQNRAHATTVRLPPLQPRLLVSRTCGFRNLEEHGQFERPCTRH